MEIFQDFIPEIVAALISQALGIAYVLEKERAAAFVDLDSAQRNIGDGLGAIANSIPEKLPNNENALSSNSPALDALPFPVWQRGAEGTMVFQNAALSTLGGETWLNSAKFSGKFVNQSLRICHSDNHATQWFEVLEYATESGTQIGCCLPIEAAIQAEMALERLMLAMTQTFAHLHVGLAIFDRSRKLTLFNPALLDVLSLQPVWLAAMPTLREFMEKLRELRKMPGASEFQEWRRIVVALESIDQSDAFDQYWTLEGGQTLHVTGRQHSNGAVALLFEDISNQIRTQRELHNESELFRVVTNRLAEAVVVFDPAGNLVTANIALNSIWGTECVPNAGQSDIRQLTSCWREFCYPTPFWGELRDFSSGVESRTSWSASVRTLANRTISCAVSPLPNGAILVIFADESPPFEADDDHFSQKRPDQNRL